MDVPTPIDSRLNVDGRLSESPLPTYDGVPVSSSLSRYPIRCDAAIYGLKEVPGLPMATRSVCNRRGLDGGQFLLAGIRLKAGMTDC